MMEPHSRPYHTSTRTGGGGTETTRAPRGPVLLWPRLLKEAAGCCPQILRYHAPFSLAPSAWPQCLLHLSFLSPPSCFPANQVLAPSQWLRTLHPSWPTQGQRARSSGPPIPSSAALSESREAPGSLPARWTPLAPRPRAGVVGIMDSRAEPTTGNQESRAPSGCPSPAKDWGEGWTGRKGLAQMVLPPPQVSCTPTHQGRAVPIFLVPWSPLHPPTTGPLRTKGRCRHKSWSGAGQGPQQ